MSLDLEELVQRHFELNREFRQLLKMKDGHQLGPPATQQEVAKIETKFGVHLPKDYRSFLLRHNGWSHFDGELDLLSTHQMLDKRIRNQVDSIASSLRDAEVIDSKTVFIVEGSPTGVEIAFYDLSSQGSGQSPTFHHWDGEELDEFSSFTDYLEFSAEAMADLVKEEKARFRKQKGKP